MRTLLCLILLMLLNPFVARALPAQGAQTTPAALPSTEFKKYRSGHQDLKLPAVITDVSLAGQGRYLLIYMKSLQTISVYDVNAARIIKDLQMVSDNILMVGGAVDLIVVNRSQNLIERWSLGNFERVAVKPLSINGEVTRLDLDFNSLGPLKLTSAEVRSDINRRGRPERYFDLQTLEEVEPPQSNQVRKLTEEEQSFNRKMGICTHPDYAISLPYRLDDKKRTPTGEGNTEHVSIFSRHPVKQLGYAEIAFMDHLKFGPRDPLFTVQKRIYFIPQADQVLSIPVPSDRLHISRLSLIKLLEKDPACLVVTSLPSRVCRRGQQWEYQVKVDSAVSDITVELSSAPEGMKISETGRLTWQVPREFQTEQVSVILTLFPREGKPEFQSFPLEIRN